MLKHKYKILLLLLLPIFIILVVQTQSARLSLQNTFKLSEIVMAGPQELGLYVDLQDIYAKYSRTYTLPQMEQIFLQNPYIKQCRMAIDYHGRLLVKLSLRHILFKVRNSAGQMFLVDRDGLKLPLVKNHRPEDFILVHGNISDAYAYKSYVSEVPLKNLPHIINHINASERLKNGLKEILVASNRDLRFKFYDQKSRRGYNFIFGSTDNFANKILKMELFFNEIVPLFAHKNYDTINLKYSDQIICSR